MRSIFPVGDWDSKRLNTDGQRFQRDVTFQRFFTVYQGKTVGVRFVQMVSKTFQMGIPFAEFILIYRESGTSLTIGAGPGNGRKNVNGTQFSLQKFGLGILDCLSKNPVFSANFPFGERKLVFPLTFQPKIPDF